MRDSIFSQALIEIAVLDKLHKSSLIDIALLTGSFARGTHDAHSDIDLFIILPLEVQTSFELLPEYTFAMTIEGISRTVEISFVTTEKLMSDRHAKTHMFWWHQAQCVYARNDELKKAFEQAAHYSKDELQDTLWTLNFQFKLGMYDFEKMTRRRPDDQFGVSLIYHDTIRIFLELMTLSRGIVRRFTSFTSEVEIIDPVLYKSLQAVGSDMEAQRRSLAHCSHLIDLTLTQAGFSDKEIKEWSKHNLTRLKFQKH